MVHGPCSQKRSPGAASVLGAGDRVNSGIRDIPQCYVESFSKEFQQIPEGLIRGVGGLGNAIVKAFFVIRLTRIAC